MVMTVKSQRLSLLLVIVVTAVVMMMMVLVMMRVAVALSTHLLLQQYNCTAGVQPHKLPSARRPHQNASVIFQPRITGFKPEALKP